MSSIRMMQLADIDRVIEIEMQVQSHPWTKSQFIESIHHYQTTVICLGRDVVGFCIMQPVLDEANLLLMAIAPEQQGKGLGYKILDDAIKRLTNHCVQIFLEVRESNVTAIGLYEKIGFHQIDIRKNYYPVTHAKREHAIIMVKLLDENIFDFKE